MAMAIKVEFMGVYLDKDLGADQGGRAFALSPGRVDDLTTVPPMFLNECRSIQPNPTEGYVAIQDKNEIFWSFGPPQMERTGDGDTETERWKNRGGKKDSQEFDGAGFALPGAGAVNDAGINGRMCDPKFQGRINVLGGGWENAVYKVAIPAEFYLM